jgi:hypothetical protein
LFFGLDAFGHDRQVEVLGQVEHGVADRRVLGRARQVLDEGAVDLQHRDREALQVGQRGIAGAEVVDRDARVALGHLGEDGLGVRRVDHQRAFGDLEHQLVAGRAGKGQGVVQHVRKRSLRNWRGLMLTEM